MQPGSYSLGSRGLSKGGGALSNAPIGRRVARFSLLYLSLSVGGYLFANWGAVDSLVVVFVMFCYGALWLGWDGPAPRAMEARSEIKAPPVFACALLTVTSVCVSVNIVSAYYQDISTLMSYLASPAAAYERVKSMRVQDLASPIFGSNAYLGLLLTCLGFTRVLVVAFLAACWDSVGRLTRTLLMVGLMAYVVETVLVGAMVNILVGLLAALPGILWRARRFRSLVPVRALLPVASVLAGVVAMAYFLGSRVTERGGDSPVERVVSGLQGLVFYGTHGYVGLGLCLHLPFVFTWGQGTLHGLAALLSRSTGLEDLSALAYPVRSEAANGRSATQLWSTAFPWLASDIGYFLCPLVMLLLGVLLRRVSNDAFIGGRLAAFPLLGTLLTGVALLPANNFLFNTVGNTATTVIFFIAYWRGSSRVNPRKGESRSVRVGVQSVSHGRGFGNRAAVRRGFS